MVHLLFSGGWTIQVVTGSAFPPLTGFSIDTLPGNRAIIFGGESVNEHNKLVHHLSNDVFILSYMNNFVVSCS